MANLVIMSPESTGMGESQAPSQERGAAFRRGKRGDVGVTHHGHPKP